MGEPSALSVRNLSAGYGGRTVLTNVSVDAIPGQITAIVGANGSGKSTLLKSIAGFAEVMAGEIILRGRAVSPSLPPHRRARCGIGYMPQRAGLFSDLTVEDNLRVAVFHNGNPSRECAAMLAKVDRLAALRYRFAAYLSGGERQLAGLAAVLIMRPRVVLVDEPLANLTDAWAEAVMALLTDSSQNHGTGVLLVEHNFAAIRRHVSDLFVLRLGTVSYAGSPDLLDSKADLSIAMLGEITDR